MAPQLSPTVHEEQYTVKAARQEVEQQIRELVATRCFTNPRKHLLECCIRERHHSNVATTGGSAPAHGLIGPATHVLGSIWVRCIRLDGAWSGRLRATVGTLHGLLGLGLLGLSLLGLRLLRKRGG